MLDVKLKVDSLMMADYLAYLFPPESEGGPLKVYARNSVGKLLVTHYKVSEVPGIAGRTNFSPPNDKAPGFLRGLNTKV